MRVSIVVPVFNEARLLPGLVDHLRELADRDPEAEVALVDGGSEDASVEVVRRAGLACLRAPRGRAAQMNAGAAASDGDVLLFLHADTRLPADALGQVRGAVRRGAVGGWFGVRLDSPRPSLRLAGRLISLRSRLTGGATGDQAIFVRRRDFQALGGYAVVPLFEDLDLIRRLRRRGPLVPLRATVVTSARRWEKLGVLRTIARMWALRTLYYCGVSPRRLARYYESAR